MSTQCVSTNRTISPKHLHEIVESGKTVDLIDVRTPAEYRSAHVPFARSQPLESLDPWAVIAARELKGEPLYVMCRSGNRSAKACTAFGAAGYADLVVNVEGGLLAWEQSGLPTVKGRYVLPLDRQLRIAIGVLVLLGTVLGYLVNPWFHGLSGFCGAGLVFAGITDFCPLGMMLARLPWNQTSGEPAQCCR